MTGEIVLLLEDESATAALARAVWRSSAGGTTLGLSGALGAGKTTFVRYLAEAAGVPPAEVSSPSFVLEQQYQGRTLRIEHWDLYRLGAAPPELLDPPEDGVLRVIEWPERGGLSAELDLHVRFEFEALRARPAARRAVLRGKGADHAAEIFAAVVSKTS